MRTNAVKRVFALLLIAVLVLLMPVTAFAATSGLYEYEVLEDGTVEITAYNGNAAELTIPQSLAGQTVSRIGESAFVFNTQLESVVIPEEVCTIGARAFMGCSSLTSVTLPDSLYSIEDGAFMNTPWYDALYQNSPNGVVYLGNCAYGWKGMEMPATIYLAEGCTGFYSLDTSGVFDHSEFEQWTDLDYEYEFYFLDRIREIVFPETCVAIDLQWIFERTSISALSIPSSVKYLTNNVEVLYATPEPYTVTYTIWSRDVQIEDYAVGYLNNFDEVTQQSSYEVNPDAVIYAYADSTAAQYAQENGIRFVALEESMTPADLQPALNTKADNTDWIWVDESLQTVSLEPGMEAGVLAQRMEQQITTLDAQGNALPADAQMGTGCVIQVQVPEQGADTQTKEYTVAVSMDVSGDGQVTSRDARLALRQAVQLENLDTAYLQAADADGDGTITSFDARWILCRSMGLSIGK